MEYTSAEAAKLLRREQETLADLLLQEQAVKEFSAASGEDREALRPAYHYEETQAEIAALEEQIRHLKHAINRFNLETEVPGFDMTIDQLLIYIPQLTRRKEKLARMKNTLPMRRDPDSYGGSIIDYRYANFDPEKAKRDYEQTCDLLSRAQTELDRLNSTCLLHIDD